MRRALPLLIACAALVPGLSACSADGPGGVPAAGALPPSAAGSPSATGSPSAAAAVVPPPGAVLQVPGPFDDRVALSGLVLRAGTVAGGLSLSDGEGSVVVLEVAATFFDAAGSRLGTAVQVVRDSPASRAVRVRVAAAPAYAPRAVAATVSVPTLVVE